MHQVEIRKMVMRGLYEVKPSFKNKELNEIVSKLSALPDEKIESELRKILDRKKLRKRKKNGKLSRITDLAFKISREYGFDLAPFQVKKVAKQVRKKHFSGDIRGELKEALLTSDLNSNVIGSSTLRGWQKQKRESHFNC